MYQQNVGNFGADGATKMTRPGAGAADGGGGAGGANNMYGSFGGGALSGYGTAGYGGPMGHGGMPGSMYGGGSLYDPMGAGPMVENTEGPIVVTKIFSSRRDLEHLVSAKDFGRRFDSNWGSYHSTGVGGYGGSMYGTNSVAEASLMNFGDKAGRTSMDRGVGAAGMGPDGDSSSKKGSTQGASAASVKQQQAAEKAAKDAAAAAAAAAAAERAKEAAAKEAAAKEAAAKVKEAARVKEMAAKEAAAKEAAAKEAAAKEAAAKEAAAKEAAAKEAAAKEAAAKEAAAKEAAAKEVAAKEAAAKKATVPEPADEIPLLAEDVRPKPKSATPTVTVPEEPPKAAEAPAKEGNGDARHARPRSRPATRPVSRITSMNVVDFPQAEEVKDEVGAGGLRDAEKAAKDAAARAEMRKEREAASRAAREERQRQRQVIEAAQKKREDDARKRRMEKEEEERLRKEKLAKMDEERKRERDTALAARDQQREEEKRHFEEAKRMEEENEAARAAALLAERQRQAEGQDKDTEERPPRSTSRPRSRRPTSRPGSGLRGAIPEQPPNEEAGQIADTLAGETLGKPAAAQADDAAAEGAQSPKAAEKTAEKAAPAPDSTTAAKKAEPASASSPVITPATEGSKSSPPTQGSKSSQPKDDKSPGSPSKSGSQRPPNMVKTLVLVEEVRNSNHALKVSDNTITYKDQTLSVTEVKTRQEDNFNYHSSVVHDVREAVCNGYNAAVLAVDAPNTAGRFDSPVWSILNRIVRTLLQENAAEGGGLRPDFELTCAMGYLYKDKVKDLLVSPGTGAPFNKITVNPSPIYGPRLTNLNYDTVTDATMFEEVLSSTLGHASDDATVQSLSEGVVSAFVLVKQTRETDGKPDIYLSSIIVASAGDDTLPYQSALSHTRNEYATVFHLVLGGPSCTCFMLNIADDDSIRKAGNAERESVSEGLERVLKLLQSMVGLQNYDLRSGSVKRFIRYVEMSHTNAQTRLEKEEDEGQRRKVERYLREQKRLLQDAYRLLEEAHISKDDA